MNRRPSHRMLRSLLVGLTLTTLVLGSSPTAYAADSWAGVRSCALFESCRVKSYATGSVSHERCTTTNENCVVKASWWNGSTKHWRTSWHGGGNQMALITTTRLLSSQSATCVCVSQTCPEVADL